jgi:Na+/proline symporter
LTLVGTMTMVGLLGLALHFGYYWAAGGLVALFVLRVVAAKRAARALERRASPLTPPD